MPGTHAYVTAKLYPQLVPINKHSMFAPPRALQVLMSYTASMQMLYRVHSSFTVGRAEVFLTTWIHSYKLQNMKHESYK